MDRSTRALNASADNAAAIDALRAELKRSTDNTAVLDVLREELKNNIGIKMRTVEGTSNGYVTPLGDVTSKTCAGVIAAFEGSSSHGLYFNGELVVTGASPLFAVLPAGTGSLSLVGNGSKGRAFIIEM